MHFLISLYFQSKGIFIYLIIYTYKLILKVRNFTNESRQGDFWTKYQLKLRFLEFLCLNSSKSVLKFLI